MKAKIDELLKSYREIYQGPNWIDVSLQDVLSDVTSELAFTDPPGGRNSVAKIVSHLVFIRQYPIKKLQGDTTTLIDQAESFNTAVYGNNAKPGWQTLKKELESTFQKIHEILQTAEPEILVKRVLPRDFNFDYLIAGIIQHEAYHTGQLEFLKKQLQSLV